MGKYPWVYLIIILIFLGCTPKAIRQIQSSEVLKGSFTGFYLYDPKKEDVLIDFNGAKYFTPASNTKIFTMYTGLNVIGDSIPALLYKVKGDSIILWGTGDPTLLHPEFNTGNVYKFLQSRGEKIYLSFANYYDEAFGAGWAWDDYYYAYQAGKASFPIYGNMIHVEKTPFTDSVRVYPQWFQKFIFPVDSTSQSSYLVRNDEDNILYYNPPMDTVGFEVDLPLKYTPMVATMLLGDTLDREIEVSNLPLFKDVNMLKSVPADSVYKRMMQASDNFLAEQVLLIASGILSDSLKTQIAIDYSKTYLLADLPDEPVWVDGSGLSRYNLFTPRSIVKLWEKIYLMVPRERLFGLIAAGGESGTIENWYKEDTPYIYGKTGTLSNNHCLSGFLITRRGKTLIFSFMNSNYNNTSSNIKKEMETILWEIYDKY